MYFNSNVIGGDGASSVLRVRGLVPAAPGWKNGKPDGWDESELEFDEFAPDFFELGELEFDANGELYAVGGLFETFLGYDAILARLLLEQGLKPQAIPDAIKRIVERGEEITNDGLVSEIIAQICTLTNNWPRSAAGTLFIDDPKRGIHYFDQRGAAGFFGWLRSRFEVKWPNGPSLPTQAEVFAELERRARRYEAIELLPHEPQIRGIYYRGATPKPGDGSYLSQLLDRFNPETTVDRDLIQAAFMTPFWGGPAGKRPIVVITSDAGRGVGKSTIPEIISYVCGGHIDVSTGADIEQIKTRMLTPTARTKRMAVIDNVKNLRLSWAEFEAIVTSPIISGKQLYVGEGQRPNLLTWFITVNGPTLATDLAQRSIIIKVARAEYSGTWVEDTYGFIDQYRSQIIADIVAALRADPFPLLKYSRWGPWEAGVLTRLPEPGEAQRLILERQGEANIDLDEVEIIEDYFAAELTRLEYDSLTIQVRIPVGLVADWYKKATGDQRISTVGANKRLRQMIGEEQIKRLADDPCHTYGRCFIWSGKNADPFVSSITNDLPERVEQLGRTIGGWRS